MDYPLDTIESRFDAEVAALSPRDAGMWLGYTGSHVSYVDGKALIQAMMRNGIAGGLVSHTACELHDARSGNEALAKELAALPQCAGVMSLVPPGTGEFDDLDAYLDSALAQGFRAVRLLPKAHRYSLGLPTVGPMLDVLAVRGIPLFIPIGQTHWDEVGRLALDHPRLAILVEGVGHHEYLNIRGCLPWLKAAGNILAPTHNQFLFGGLELLASAIGDERILFASNQPYDDPAAGLSLLVYSRLSADAKKRIARGNLDRLMEAVGKGGYFG